MEEETRPPLRTFSKEFLDDYSRFVSPDSGGLEQTPAPVIGAEDPDKPSMGIVYAYSFNILRIQHGSCQMSYYPYIFDAEEEKKITTDPQN